MIKTVQSTFSWCAELSRCCECFTKPENLGYFIIQLQWCTLYLQYIRCINTWHSHLAFTLVTNTLFSFQIIIPSPSQSHIHSALSHKHHPSTHRSAAATSPAVCCPAPPHPPLPAIRANLPVANTVVLTFHGTALWINVLLPWHQVLVTLGSPCGWLAHDYYAFHKPAITENAYISKPTKYIMAYNNT